MGNLSTRRPSPALVISLIALFFGLGGGAYAALKGIPDSRGVFHGCVDKRTGALRVVKSAKQLQQRSGRVPCDQHDKRLAHASAVGHSQ
jgi:hypothetical protein